MHVHDGMPDKCRLMVGSGMLKAGEWDNEAWRELSAEGVMPIPAILQQIDHIHIEKVRASTQHFGRQILHADKSGPFASALFIRLF